MKRSIERDYLETVTQEVKVTTAAEDAVRVEENSLETVFTNCERVVDETNEQLQDGIDEKSVPSMEEVIDDKINESAKAEERTELTEIVDDVDETIDKALQDIVEEVAEVEESTDDIKVEHSEFSYEGQEILSDDGKYALEMVDTVTPENMISAGIQLFLRDKVTGDLLIGNENNLKLPRESILLDDNHRAMDIIKKYDVAFSKDTIDAAWDKAHEMLKSGTMHKVGTSSSLTILEAYRAVVVETIRRKKNNIEDTNEKGKSDYFTDIEALWIKTTKLAEILDAVDSGFKPATFCKRLALAGAVSGFSYIEHTGHGYATNTNANVRYYVLKIPKEFYEELVNEGLVKKND